MKNRSLAEAFTDDEESANYHRDEFPGPVYATSGIINGEIYLQWDAVQNANKYVIQVSKRSASKNNNGEWEHVDMVKDPLYCITGLKPGREYCFRVAAVYPESIGQWSSAVSKKVK